MGQSYSDTKQKRLYDWDACFFGSRFNDRIFPIFGGVGFLLSKIPDGQADTLLFLEIGIHNLNLFQALFLGLKVV